MGGNKKAKRKAAYKAAEGAGDRDNPKKMKREKKDKKSPKRMFETVKQTEMAPTLASAPETKEPKKQTARPAKLKRDNKKKREAAEKEKKRKEDYSEDEPEYWDRRIYVGNLPDSTQDEDLKDLFSRFGEIHHAKLNISSKGIFRGFGFVTFEDRLAMDESLSMNGLEHEGKVLKVMFAKPPAAKVTQEIALRGLSFKATDKDIRKIFKGCGDISRVIMKKHDSGNFNGVAFVKFASSAGAELALKKDGLQVDGRNLNVWIAHPKKMARSDDKLAKLRAKEAGLADPKAPKAEEKEAAEGAKSASGEAKGKKRKAGAAGAEDAPKKKTKKKAAKAA